MRFINTVEGMEMLNVAVFVVGVLLLLVNVMIGGGLIIFAGLFPTEDEYGPIELDWVDVILVGSGLLICVLLAFASR